MSLIRDGNIIRDARRIVAKARRDGAITAPSRCSKCKRKSQRVHGHHEDYTKPLDLIWLCPECHRRRHCLTQTGDKGRHRCLACKKIIYRHIEDAGLAREVDGGVVHTRCIRKLNAA